MAEDAEMTDEKVSSTIPFAERYMAKHGWREGQGLGVAGEGRVEAVAAVKRPYGLGLGAETKTSRKLWRATEAWSPVPEQQQMVAATENSFSPPSSQEDWEQFLLWATSMNGSASGTLRAKVEVEAQELRNSIFGAALHYTQHEFIEYLLSFGAGDTGLERLPIYILHDAPFTHSFDCAVQQKNEMPDFSFTEDSELQQLNAQVLEEPEEFEHWEKLVRAAESQEGGLNRNSSPQAIAATRDTYDLFLARFPLFFGYWKKYADLEFAIAGTEAAEMVYERGVASIGTSVDLWANYCGFKLETTHDIDVIRDLFERGAESVGLDFLAHPFWDKYLIFEERLEAHDRVFKILDRIIHIPMHQYARYFERYRGMTQTRQLTELAPLDVIAAIRGEIERESGMKPRSEADTERDIRTRLDALHLETFQRTQTETTKRWTYESEIKRPYYHVTDLDEAQLANWRKYLDSEEAEGDYTRTKFLYERCLVTAANYDEFWHRYARWMFIQGKQEEVRNIYQRASCVFVRIARPSIRLFYAHFEESIGQPAIAADIHEAILMVLPSHLETIISLANLRRRQSSVEAAIEVLRRYIDSPETATHTKGALVSEWARMVCEIQGYPDEARKIYKTHQQAYEACRPFWLGWFSMEAKHGQYAQVKAVYAAAQALKPDAFIELTKFYLAYLQERGGPETMKEWMAIDAQIMRLPAAPALSDGEDMVMGQNGMQYTQ